MQIVTEGVKPRRAMKFPRNARILRSQLDAAPFAAVFFLLVIFMMLGSLVLYAGGAARAAASPGQWFAGHG